MTRGERGLTLVELLIGLTIAGIVMTSIVKMFLSMSSGYTTQNSVADLQQSIRAVAALMTQEIRMAGFSSLSESGFGITVAEPGKLSFTVDWDNDGLVTASHSGNDAVLQESDVISYFFDPVEKSLKRRTAEGTGNVYTQSLLGGSGDVMEITGVSFSFQRKDDEETNILADIGSIGFSITARTLAGARGTVERTYQTQIKCRNLGL